MPPTANVLGDAVRAIRRSRRVTREELVELAGVSYSWLSAIESGKDGRGNRPLPSPPIIRSIARGLATDPTDHTIDHAQEEQLYDQLMVAAGYIADDQEGRLQSVPRGYQPVRDARTKVAAGRYIIEPTQDGTIAVEDSFASGRDLLQVTVTGSCLDPDLRHGEVAVVDRARKDPRPGDIVVALTPDGELLVKRYDVDPDGPVLKDNGGNTWRPDGTTIEGVVVASWRRH